LIITGELETSRWENQAFTLHRPGITHLGSHFGSIKSLLEIFRTTRTLLSKIDKNRPNSQLRADIFKYYLAITSFDFVLLMMNKLCELLFFFAKRSKEKIKIL
jgi:hypothetical protein